MRGKQDRQRVEQIKEEKEQNGAAQKLQAQMRGKQDRQRVEQIRDGAVDVSPGPRNDLTAKSSFADIKASVPELQPPAPAPTQQQLQNAVLEEVAAGGVRRSFDLPDGGGGVGLLTPVSQKLLGIDDGSDGNDGNGNVGGGSTGVRGLAGRFDQMLGSDAQAVPGGWPNDLDRPLMGNGSPARQAQFFNAMSDVDMTPSASVVVADAANGKAGGVGKVARGGGGGGGGGGGAGGNGRGPERDSLSGDVQVDVVVSRLNEQALIDSSPASPPRSADDNNRRRSSGSFDGVGGAGDDASSVGNGGASTAGGQQQQQQQQQQPLPTTQQQAGIDAGLLMEAPGGTILISRAELEVSFFFF